MNSLELTAFGKPTEVVALRELAPTEPGGGEVLVQLEAAPINPSDLLLIAGVYGVRPDLPAPLGAEGVGSVVAVGDGVAPSRVGERVLVVPRLTHGTWREQVIVEQDDAVTVDPDADPLQLAMLGINPATAYLMLQSYAKLQPGAWVAQTGASSATAGYVLALAKHAGLRTLSVVRRADAVEPLLEAGSDVVLVEGDGLHREAADALGRDRRELILDAVGGEPVAQLAGLMNVGGHVVSYTARDLQPVSIRVGDLIFRGINVHGFWLNHWIDAAQPAEVIQTYQELAALVAHRTLSAPVEATYALEDHRAALGHAASRNGRRGKILFAFG
jgi:NADPH:quinone reductase-like Zn-dependent oxidoreductase